MITRAPLIIPPNGAIFLPAWRQLNREGSEPKRVEGENVRLSGSRAESRRSNFIGGRGARSSARSSFHKHIYRRLDALQWRFNLANAFCALWPAGLSLSLFLSFYPLPISLATDSLVSSLSLSFWRKPVDGANFFHREQPGLVKVDPFQVKKQIFFFGNESLFHWTFFGTSFFFCLIYR